jgi:hypothetical protein
MSWKVAGATIHASAAVIASTDVGDPVEAGSRSEETVLAVLREQSRQQLIATFDKAGGSLRRCKTSKSQVGGSRRIMERKLVGESGMGSHGALTSRDAG